MKRKLSWIAWCLLAGAGVYLSAQEAQPSHRPTDVELEMLGVQTRALGRDVAALRASGADDALLVDVEVYHKACEWMLRYPEEYYRKIYIHDALDVAAEGRRRAAALAKGETPWLTTPGRIARGYRSQVDGSVQPYIVDVPPGYDGKPLRLDVVLHGRNSRLNEVSFLTSAARPRAGTPKPDYLQLEVYGRTNNAYRWAGEADVFEAMAAVERNYRVDLDRVVLRGFSMGGAGTWQIGLHHPDRWVAMEAGAGFTDTLVYTKNSLPADVPEWQKRAMHIYDAVDYSVNARTLAVVGYGGEIDPQLQAAVNIREALARDGAQFRPDGLNFTTDSLNAVFLVGPDTPHRFHPDSKARSNAFLDAAVAHGRQTPDKVRFVTRTTRYAQSFWVRVDGLERSYDEAEVVAERKDGTIVATTRNVSRLVFEDAGAITRVEIDGRTLEPPAQHSAVLWLGKSAGNWALYESQAAMRGSPRVKRPGLQGPIDDAFTQPFLVVAPSGKAWNAAANRAALTRMEIFRQEYPKWLRADTPLKTDAAVTNADIADHNLILFGDPGSNALIARVLDGLPLRWTREAFELGGRSYGSGEALPVLIFPNPLNPDRYVVLNSGHTFHAPEFRGTNALLYPRLGDWAVLPVDGGAPLTAGFFDESWH
ncbi:MAG: prolyl oligopeptidase family serine peptidase [Bryobacterales bacterium]